MRYELTRLLFALTSRGIALPGTLDPKLRKERLRVLILSHHIELEPLDTKPKSKTIAEGYRHVYGEFLDRRARARDSQGRPHTVPETPRPDDDEGEEEEASPRKSNFATLHLPRR